MCRKYLMVAVVGISFYMVSCQSSTAPSESNASDYLFGGAVGTIYEYEIQIMDFHPGGVDTIHRTAYYKLLEVSAPVPNGEQGIRYERRIPFTYTGVYLTDTAFIYAKGPDLFTMQKDIGRDVYNVQRILKLPAVKGDKVMATDIDAEGSTVVGTDISLDTKVGTIRAIQLNRDSRTDIGTYVISSSSKLFYAVGLPFVRREYEQKTMEADSVMNHMESTSQLVRIVSP